MRDPDLVGRAQRAAIELERAWDRWRTMHGLSREPMPAVSSYVGYSLEEPWGQPRVVFGIEAREAEQLAALLDRHDCAGPVYAAIASMPGSRAEESAEFPGTPTEHRRVMVPSQPQPGVAEREAAWREATWREAMPAEPVKPPPPRQPRYPAEAPGQQVTGEVPAPGYAEALQAGAMEPAGADEPELVQAEPDDAGPEDRFLPHAEAVPHAREEDEQDEDEEDQASQEADEPAEADQGSALWRRPARRARGDAVPRPKRSGGTARGRQ